MAAGDITATITSYESAAALKTALDADSTGAATVGTSTTDFQVVPDGSRSGVFWVIKIERAAA